MSRINLENKQDKLCDTKINLLSDLALCGGPLIPSRLALSGKDCIMRGGIEITPDYFAEPETNALADMSSWK
jgi:hypothetical protein